MRSIFMEYFNEIHRIDVSTKYAEMMEAFVANPDLEKLFADYWDLYIRQFPEAIFQKVNENFYRSTFFELCSRYLSHLFTWNVERSYPTGRSDLEFVGKYDRQHAGLRYVLEFKYYSNQEIRKQRINIKKFQLIPGDQDQIEGYCQGLAEEYPQSRVFKYVIYCFGNKGYRIFRVI
jgi:hypothetical protein